MKMSSRRVSLPVALSIPQKFPSRLSPPNPSSPASPGNRRSLPTSPICRRSLPSTPRTISPRRNNNLLPDVDEHFASTSSSSETSPRRVKKRRPPPRYQYSLQTGPPSMQHSIASQDDEEAPEGSLRSFDIKNGQVIDNGYKQISQDDDYNSYKGDRRATCPELYLFPETSNKPMQHVVLRVYGAKNCGKKTLLSSIDQFATKLVTRYNNEPSDGDETNSKMINFLLNNEQIELEILLESTLENSPFVSCLTMYAIVYNVDSRESFMAATSLVQRLLTRKISKNSNVVLVGNKVDLKRNTVVSKIEGLCVAKIHKIHFVEISALLSMNIAELWNLILKQIQNPIIAESNESSESIGWMNRLLNRGKQLAHSAEQIVSKIVN